MPNQPVRRVVRGTLTQWNRLFRGAGRHSDLVTVRRRSQGNTAGRKEKLVVIGSQIFPSVLVGLMLCSLQSFIHFPCLACLSTRCCFLHPQPVHLTFRVATLPERKSTAQGQAKDRCCWDGIGLDRQEDNKILVTSPPRYAGLKLVINNVLSNSRSSSCHRRWACYCMLGHRPAKGTISLSLNNAAFEGAVLRASRETQISQILSLFWKTFAVDQPRSSFPKTISFFKHSKLLAPAAWGIIVNTPQDQEFALNS